MSTIADILFYNMLHVGRCLWNNLSEVYQWNLTRERNTLGNIFNRPIQLPLVPPCGYISNYGLWLEV